VLHRAITLAVLTGLSVLMLAAMLLSGLGAPGHASLISLAVVVGAAIATGAAFSWRRYFPRRR
jgi:hypothetical protein